MRRRHATPSHHQSIFAFIRLLQDFIEFNTNTNHIKIQHYKTLLPQLPTAIYTSITNNRLYQIDTIYKTDDNSIRNLIAFDPYKYPNICTTIAHLLFHLNMSPYSITPTTTIAPTTKHKRKIFTICQIPSTQQLFPSIPSRQTSNYNFLHLSNNFQPSSHILQICHKSFKIIPPPVFFTFNQSQNSK